MKIVSMTATFGKLDGQTLTLKPGLNVISAPNEWGKSTWCAFLMAMFYGIDTRQRTKQGTLADKEHYKPWSGRPMEGSVELIWKGRAITIQRRTQGRIPMGVFRAYETDSGLNVPELTAENCGLMLLGVERGVYARSGFIGAASMAVSPDEDLSRRLNQLVTTGDDNPGGLTLGTKLRELNRKCEYRSSGLLPQTRQALSHCRQELQQHQELRSQQAELRRQLQTLDQQKAQLLRHKEVLSARQNQEKLERVEQAKKAQKEAAAALSQAWQQCRGLPSMEETRRKLEALEQLDKQKQALELEFAMLPAPDGPEQPPFFAGLSPDEAMEKAQREEQHLQELEAAAGRPGGVLWLIPALISLAVGAMCLWVFPLLFAGIGAWVLSLVFTILFFRTNKKKEKAIRAFELYESRLDGSYGGQRPIAAAESYGQSAQGQLKEQSDWAQAYAQKRRELEAAEQALGYDRKTLEEAQAAWTAWADAQRAAVGAEHYLKSIEVMAAGLSAKAVQEQTPLPLTQQQTDSALEKINTMIQNTRSQLDAALGHSRALPGEEQLKQREDTLILKIQELEKWQKATDLSLSLLEKAQRELQSRFAPKISTQASRILSGFTGGKYDHLLLQQDFSLLTTCHEDTTARDVFWHSTGTTEQTYLALRLAVSKALIPHAPLVLDDALSHFDDERMGACLDFLSGEDQQIILFSCQNREQQWLKNHSLN